MPEKTQPPVQAAAAQTNEPAPPAAAARAGHRVAVGRLGHGRGNQRHAGHVGKPGKMQQAEAAKITAAKITPRRQVKVASLKKREK
jgi:hypothetical protein